MLPLRDPNIHRHATPYVVYGLVMLNAVVYLFQLTLPIPDQYAFTYQLGAIPWELTGGGEMGRASFTVNGRPTAIDLTSTIPTWATIFSSMFLHAGFLHLGGNMLFLAVFGNSVESRFGHLLFLAFYVLVGVVAVWAQVSVDNGSQVPIVGASGAIAGVLGAYVLMSPRSRMNSLAIFGRIVHFPPRAVLLIGGWALWQLMNGLGSLDFSSTGSGVAYFAHVGGFVTGLGSAALYRRATRRTSPPGLINPG